MNSTSDTQNPRAFGYWIKAVDRLMSAEFATAFESEGATRRDWRLLNVIDGSAPAARPLHPGKLRGLVERGWVAKDGDGWTLTDEGRAAKERLGAVVDGIRAQVADAVSPDDFDTTVATLEQIARTFGWDENTPLPRGRRGEGRGHGKTHRGEHHGHAEHHGHGRRHGAPFGRGHGFGRGFRHGFGHDFPRDADAHECQHPHAHGEGHGRSHGRPFDRERGPRFAPEFGHGVEHPHGRDRRAAQVAFERGFDAGFSRGRDA
ncbi:hypothetical protein QFZ53_000241 [Microbacterium natoriense]|uniref:MarR family transcriptional regulator n=1 Tax=Microbacterium natoriense TaxID=284570 RepID=A0AAW8ERK2_9MICO|nr:hypothetical protein [Microbacterium natoriense]MDQ0646045.1 hypothetical protein [Microbacterium natoriense]